MTKAKPSRRRRGCWGRPDPQRDRDDNSRGWRSGHRTPKPVIGNRSTGRCVCLALDEGAQKNAGLLALLGDAAVPDHLRTPTSTKVAPQTSSSKTSTPQARSKPWTSAAAASASSSGTFP